METVFKDELDVRPKTGEFFHPDGRYVPDPDPNLKPVCFVCGAETRCYGREKLLGIVQCREAASRVVTMFERGAYTSSGTFYNGQPGVTVTVCSNHQFHLAYLAEVTQDGVITAEHIDRLRRSIISGSKFRELVGKGAHELFCSKAGGRQVRDWDDAWSQLTFELGHIPSPVARQARTYSWSCKASGASRRRLV